MHHTDSTAVTFDALSSLIKPQGKFVFYVYKERAN